jgi:hypothetical protein
MKSPNVGQVVLLAGGGAIVLYLLLRRRFAHSPSAPPRQEKNELPRAPSRGEPAEPTTQKRGVSLQQVDPKNQDATATDVDIIAIHGLDTKSPDTWVWRPDCSKSTASANPKAPKGVNWLEDGNMLPAVVGSARIFMCDWPADMFEDADLVQKTLEEFARLLLEGIKRERLSPTKETRKDRPILFIASCLGGILLMKALTMATGPVYDSLRKTTSGINFLATPFRGTSLQDVARPADLILGAWASIQSRKVTKLLDSLKSSTFQLEDLVREFTRLCQNPDNPYHVFTFYEKGKTDLSRKIFPLSLPLSKAKQVRPIKCSTF